MNMDPKSSRNYDKSIEKTALMNQGAHHDVGDKRLSVKEIAKIINLSTGRTGALLKTYTAEKLIAREKIRKRNKSSNLSRQEP